MNTFLQFIHRKRLAYQRVFLGPDGRPNPEAIVVLADLKRVAGINRGGIVVSPISRMVDSHASVYRAGQRDMFLRIMKFLDLEEADNMERGNDRAESATE